jgi:uncharacterized protein (TIGR02001 family)
MAGGTLTTRMLLSLAACCAAGMMTLVPVRAGAGERWGGSVTVTSDYRLRGISQSDRSPAAQLDLHYDAASGWLAGLWASTIRRDRYQSVAGELNAFVGYRWALDADWNAKLSAAHYLYPWDSSGRTYDYDEFVAAAAYRDRAFLSIAYSPDAAPFPARWESRRPAALSAEFALRMPLTGGFSGSTGLGHYHLGDRQSSGYWYWSAGLGYGFERLHLDFTYFGTSGAARSLFYEGVAENGWAGTITWSF